MNNYLKYAVGLPLAQCMTELTEKQPQDPIEWIAMWLYRYMDCEIYFYEKKHMLKSMQKMRLEIKREHETRQGKINKLTAEIKRIYWEIDENGVRIRKLVNRAKKKRMAQQAPVLVKQESLPVAKHRRSKSRKRHRRHRSSDLSFVSRDAADITDDDDDSQDGSPSMASHGLRFSSLKNVDGHIVGSRSGSLKDHMDDMHKRMSSMIIYAGTDNAGKLERMLAADEAQHSPKQQQQHSHPQHPKHHPPRQHHHHIPKSSPAHGQHPEDRGRSHRGKDDHEQEHLDDGRYEDYHPHSQVPDPYRRVSWKNDDNDDDMDEYDRLRLPRLSSEDIRRDRMYKYGSDVHLPDIHAASSTSGHHQKPSPHFDSFKPGQRDKSQKKAPKETTKKGRGNDYPESSGPSSESRQAEQALARQKRREKRQRALEEGGEENYTTIQEEEGEYAALDEYHDEYDYDTGRRFRYTDDRVHRDLGSETITITSTTTDDESSSYGVLDYLSRKSTMPKDSRKSMKKRGTVVSGETARRYSEEQDQEFIDQNGIGSVVDLDMDIDALRESRELLEKVKRLSKMMGSSTWTIDCNLDLICHHTILGTLMCRPPFVPPETPEWWAKQGYIEQSFYDPEIYTGSNVDKSKLYDLVPTHLTNQDFVRKGSFLQVGNLRHMDTATRNSYRKRPVLTPRGSRAFPEPHPPHSRTPHNRHPHHTHHRR